jgi:hypothetical protein
LPFVVHVGEDGAHEAHDGGLVREDPHDAAASLDLLVDPLEGFVDEILVQWLRGKAVKARTSARAVSMRGPILGNRPASWSRTWSQVAATVAGSGWAKIVRNTAATMSWWDLGTRASRLRAKWTRHR